MHTGGWVVEKRIEDDVNISSLECWLRDNALKNEKNAEPHLIHVEF